MTKKRTLKTTNTHKIMKNLLKITALSLLTTPLFAQYTDVMFRDQYALMLSMPNLHGNARFSSMGGAFGALGGNLSALSTNPASIGIYRRGEFSFTPAITFGQSEVNPIGTDFFPVSDARSLQSDRTNFNTGNFGFVSAYDISKSESQDEWKFIQFGFGLNRIADFWNRSGYTGYADWSYLSELTFQANKDGAPRGTIRGTAFRADIIWRDGPNGRFFNDLGHQDTLGNWIETTGLNQRQYTETRGAINEWFMSFGGNYGDFLYLGATLGIPSVSFRQTRVLNERDLLDEHDEFNSWRFEEELRINGSGINLKLGAIVRPTDFLRLGLAFHTPTRYSLRENYTIRVSGNGLNIPSGTTTERLAEFAYSIRTPMKLIGSVGFVIGRQALIGIEYEHLDYGRMRVGGFDPDFDADNEFIADTYGRGGVIRVGAEYRLQQVSLRLGYNYTRTPYQGEVVYLDSDLNYNPNFTGQSISAGVGFQVGSTTIDLAYVNTMRKYKGYPYDYMPLNQYDITQHQFMVTFGWRF
jgi:hypothetical protein